MDNKSNNTHDTINETSPSMPTQTVPVEGPPSPSQTVSNSVDVSRNPYESSQIQYQNQVQPNKFEYSQNQTANMHPQTMTNSNTRRNYSQSKIKNPLLNSDDLIKAFIGPNYEKILRRPINFAAFFFTSFYYFYRKMNLYAVIIIILQGAILYFFNSTPYAILIFNLLCALITNKLYFGFAARKISKTLMDNPDKSVEEVKGMCYVIGGRSIARVFILLLLIAPYIFIILLLILLAGSLSSFEEFIKNIDFSDIKLPEIKLSDIEIGNKFDGNIITDKTNKVLDYFNIITPSDFKPTSSNDEYLLNYEYKSNKMKLSTCSYQFGGVNGYSNPKILINKMHEYYKDKKPSDVKKEIINRITWYSFNLQNEDKSNIYYYACSRGNMVYLYSFLDEKNSSNACHSYLESIINTISYR